MPGTLFSSATLVWILEQFSNLCTHWYGKYMQYFKKVTDCSPLILLSISSYENYYALHSTWMCQTFYAELPLRSFWIFDGLNCLQRALFYQYEDNYTYISTSLNSIWYVALDFETKVENIYIIAHGIHPTIPKLRILNFDSWNLLFKVR